MNIVWTSEALSDLESIIIYYLEKVGFETAVAIESRIVAQIESLNEFPERIRESERIAGAREAVIPKLPFIAFVRVLETDVQVLNIVHTSRKFP
jgi:plasmid stabilization system protein ParE